jgi:hypothetical protein
MKEENTIPRKKGFAQDLGDVTGSDKAEIVTLDRKKA